jgi:hypothetical protein
MTLEQHLGIHQIDLLKLMGDNKGIAGGMVVSRPALEFYETPEQTALKIENESKEKMKKYITFGAIGLVVVVLIIIGYKSIKS